MRSLLVVALGCLALALLLGAVLLAKEMIWHGRLISGLASFFAILLLELFAYLIWERYFPDGPLHRLASHICNWFYDDSYHAESDELARLIAKMEQEGTPEDLPRLRRLVMAEKKRMRGWLALARFHRALLHDDRAAADIFEESATYLGDRQERAMALYRAAQICRNNLKDEARARALLEKAAKKYPRTAYGKKAAETLQA